MENAVAKEGRGPRREVVASYGSYAEAQGAVDRLADERFPVERVSIVAEGLRFEEWITGRKGYGRAALEGLGAGALPGALVGFVFGLFGLVDPLVSGLVLGLYGFIFGALIGAVFGLVSHAFYEPEAERGTSTPSAEEPNRGSGRRLEAKE